MGRITKTSLFIGGACLVASLLPSANPNTGEVLAAEEQPKGGVVANFDGYNPLQDTIELPEGQQIGIEAHYNLGPGQKSLIGFKADPNITISDCSSTDLATGQLAQNTEACQLLLSGQYYPLYTTFWYQWNVRFDMSPHYLLSDQLLIEFTRVITSPDAYGNPITPVTQSDVLNLRKGTQQSPAYEYSNSFLPHLVVNQ